MRVAVLGGFAFVLFAVIFFRLWFLQVLSGEDYVTQARENRVRKIKIEAPRGDIVDRDGNRLVRTRVAPVVQIVPSGLPDAELKVADSYRAARSSAERTRLAAAGQLRSLERTRREEERRYTRAERRERRVLVRASRRARPVAVPPMPASEPQLRRSFSRLGRVLGMSPRTIHRRVIEGIAEAPYSNVTVKTDVPRAAFNYLKERKDEFPGVDVEKLFLRSYPHKELAAQLFGTLREISPAELKKKKYRGVAAGTRIGKDGIEETYDRYLRGQDGYTRVVINALGNRDDRREVTRREPQQGQRLRLTLDLDLQRAANNAIKRAIGAANAQRQPVEGGRLRGDGPEQRRGARARLLPVLRRQRLRQAAVAEDLRHAQLRGERRAAVQPRDRRRLSDRLDLQADHRDGGAGGGHHHADADDLRRRRVQARPADLPQRAQDARYGPLAMPRALQVSSDVFFYTLGERANSRGPIIQKWARKLGLGHRTGIDIPGEFDGLVPDRKWRDAGFAKYSRCVKREKVPAQTLAALKACGGIERPWSTGDNVNLSVGQGDLQATPLQMATAYSAIANGGKVVRPHLAHERRGRPRRARSSSSAPRPSGG